ncbi:MAG: hypothetical protein ACP5SH_01025 [Syntrophobacteraceae bacterium]
MNRKVIVGVGAALVVIGLAGIGLEQSGVIFPQARQLPAVAPSGPSASGGAPAQSVGNQGPEKPAPIAPPLGTGSAPKSATAAVTGATGAAKVRRPPLGKHPLARPGQETLTSRTVRHRVSSPLNPAAPDLAARSPRYSRLQKPGVFPSGPDGRLAPARVAPSSMHPVVIRFTFDPSRDRPFDVASVHLGDRVRVSVRRVGQVSRRVYFTFSKGLDSRRGALLELKTMYPFEPPRYSRGRPGYYVIRVRIYPNNRWGILPRSLV